MLRQDSMETSRFRPSVASVKKTSCAWEFLYSSSVKETKPASRKAAEKTSDAPKSVDEYLAGVPEPARSTLNTIRATIRSAMPAEATEVISYRIPAFKYKGMLVSYGAFSDHCSLFPGSGIIEAFADELKRYPISKGTIQFPLDKPLPATLLRKIVKARVAANEKKKRQ
jgi:uncharacterized protein YdhG (YjbR/CyaY superfamily)